MTFTSWSLFAADLPRAGIDAAEGAVRTTFEWGRIQSNSDWILPVGVFVAIGLFVWIMYRRDAVELPPLLAWFLIALRTVAFLGLLLFYLQPQWRTEREVTRNSRTMLLVDTSLSMGLVDAESPASAGGVKSRIEEVAEALADTDLLEQLRKIHDVAVWRFDEDLDRDRLTLQKLLPEAMPAEDTRTPSDDTADQAIAATDDASGDNTSGDGASSGEAETPPEEPVDWNKFFRPGGSETRLGMALQQLINDESGAPLAGIIVFTDGGQNAGIAPEAALELARKAKIPIFTVGLGSDKQPVNVRVSDLVVPARAYPGDRYVVTGFVQAQGMAGRVVDVQLLARRPGDAAGSESGSGELKDRQQVTLGGDGEVIPVKFELTPEVTGRRTLVFRIRAPNDDHNADDNFREADIEIVDRKNHVLLLAGGPTREYRFLRTLLYRDRSTVIDVLLQTAQHVEGLAGISQEADNLLDDFPTTRPQMFDYDCVLAFDPDWQALSTTQVDLLEQWVAEQGGGLIVIAGPVFTGTMVTGWVEDENPAMAKIRGLYPVVFHHRFSTLEEGVYVTKEPWPLDFTREGFEAEYLWLDDTATAGRQAWAGFDGVYSVCPVRGPKPGATVLARFSDPRIGAGGEQPVFFAGQFYGSGRVFYLGSGEMWRLRQLDDTYFEQFYTKLLRHVSQGRLLRGSSRGVLLVGQERYLLGNTVEVRAQLTNARLEPLDLPEVPLQVIRPDGSLQSVVLELDPSRKGTYAGRFSVVEEGSYRLQLEIPDSGGERLTRRIQVKVPDLERENPRRNDALLSRIAESTGGKYYLGLPALLDLAAEDSILKRLPDRTETIIFTAVPNPLWKETWMRWMILTLCGLLCLEWLIRRLVKLA